MNARSTYKLLNIISKGLMGDETVADTPIKFDEVPLKDNEYGFLRRNESKMEGSEDVPKVR